MDSGAGESVCDEGEVPEAEAKESWGSRNGQTYEVANGDEIPNEGEKQFRACAETLYGGYSEEKAMTVQVCSVHRPLMSVKMVCRAGHRVVFDDAGSYVENKTTLERLKIEEKDGEYIMDMWVRSDAGFAGQKQGR